MILKNRQEAAILLADQLKNQKFKDPLVIALPRGGVPIAATIADRLQASLDVLIVRKIGAPHNPEFGIGAISEGDFTVLNERAIEALRISDSEIQKIIHVEQQELQRRVEIFRGSRPLQKIKGRTVLLVDDGLATGITAQVAVEYVKKHGAQKVIFCSPVCSEEGARMIGKIADQVICLQTSDRLSSISLWYEDFPQLEDVDVTSILSQFSAANATVAPEGEVSIRLGRVVLKGSLLVPPSAKGLIVFAHGSGSSRFSPRNQQVAESLNQQGFGTLLFDLLTQSESKDRSLVFDIELLADRLVAVTRWLRKKKEYQKMPIGFFGASTGGGAALWAAAELGAEISAVVSRGGRPDLAREKLRDVVAPTLLIVGGEDADVLDLNQSALRHIRFGKLSIVEGATHLFEEPGALEQVQELAGKWFQENLRFFNPVLKSRLTLAEEIDRRARPFESIKDLKPLIERIKDSKVVMLGEASHGTHEFYHWRRLISQELIENHGFQFIAVEGDWPPCQRVNQFVKSYEGRMAENTLKNFRRWPTWMWANEEVAELCEWLRQWNQDRPTSKQVGFYGLDVYSLFESIEEVDKIVSKINPDLSQHLKRLYSCFDPYRDDERKYVRSLLQFSKGCEQEVLQGLRALLQQRLNHGQDGRREQWMDATQNARIIANAEHYYRSMIHIEDESWNIRDRHMTETLDLLLQSQGKGIVWEHNTHIGDYRATDMVSQGHINIGGLAREEWGRENVSLVGFGTYQGQVIASHAWAGPIEVMPVPAAKPGSIEAALHACAIEIGEPNFLLMLDEETRQTALADVLGHRAIGVVYDPSQERRGNYVPTSLAQRYDAFLYLDFTKALSPLEFKPLRQEMPETYPTGI